MKKGRPPKGPFPFPYYALPRLDPTFEGCIFIFDLDAICYIPDTWPPKYKIVAPERCGMITGVADAPP